MHYDLYRLKVVKEIDQLGFFENLENVITIVEWPEIRYVRAMDSCKTPVKRFAWERFQWR